MGGTSGPSVGPLLTACEPAGWCCGRLSTVRGPMGAAQMGSKSRPGQETCLFDGRGTDSRSIDGMACIVLGRSNRSKVPSERVAVEKAMGTGTGPDPRSHLPCQWMDVAAIGSSITRQPRRLPHGNDCVITGSRHVVGPGLDKLEPPSKRVLCILYSRPNSV